MSATQGSGEFNVRGYAVVRAAAFLKQLVDEREGNAIIHNMSPSTREAIATRRPADWVPVAALSEVTRAVASTAAGNEELARERLISCGLYMAEEAANTFLRLLMKLITPELFSKKIPAIWEREFTQGKLTAEVQPSSIICRAHGMQGFDHGICTSAGFVTYVFKTMGKPVKSTTVHGWTLDKPWGDNYWFEIAW